MLTKVHIVKAIVFFSSQVQKWEWTIKKTECQRIDASELWCWRKLLGIPWTARRSNQPIITEINPEYSFKRLLLKLKHKNFGYLMWWAQLIGKDPNSGKDWGQEEKGATEDEMVGWPHQLNGHKFEQTPWDSEGLGSLACCSPWDHKESDMTEWLNNNNTAYLII